MGALSTMTVKTSKSEDMCLVNGVDSHIIIFFCTSNLRVLCTQVKEIVIDGTFKCCLKFFEQLYTIHGYSNSHYIPLVFALLVSKSEDPRCTSIRSLIIYWKITLCRIQGFLQHCGLHYRHPTQNA